MKNNILTKLQRSLFLKIVVVFILAYAVISIVSVILHRSYMFKSHFDIISSNAVHYCDLMIGEFGNPPDTIMASGLADRLGMRIRIESPDYVWASDTAIPPVEDLELQDFDVIGGTRIELQRGVGLCVDLHRGTNHFLFILDSEWELYEAQFMIYQIIIFSTITIVILLVFMAIRWLLHPIRVLHEGVRQVGCGNLEYEIRSNRSDELGELVNSFGTMTERVKEMLHARDQLLLDVSHELRSPLTRARVGLEFMKEGTARDGVRDDITEMETMITELLESHRLNSRFGKLNLQPTNISALVREVYTEFESQKPGLKLLSLPEEVMLNVEPERTVTLFKNIIANALKYSDADGCPVEISIRRNQAEVIVVVQDFGSGIPEKELPYIFEPFYRVDKSRSKETGGYGLGLSMCKKIMEAYGGDIEITSKADAGTTVYLKFVTTFGNSGA